ncbi:MAG: polyphosphate kinase 2 [Cytophagales bacterium]|nr:polyphosphate kinase 2 [Cytophagales bacterium]
MEIHSLENHPEYVNLQVEMINMQRWVHDTGQRVIILFEGRDTAGKGGAIMRFVRFINPRGYRIVALSKPNDIEKGQWYFQRYLKELPDPGQIIFFDRSWYNRAVVEPVMGFCSQDQYEGFMQQVVMLEKMLVRDGVHIFKLWFSIELKEQKRRLEQRQTDPLKKWKLSTVDMQAQLKWHDYTGYKDEMFKRTSWEGSPWIVINGNDKDVARLEAMRYVLNSLDYPEKGETGERLIPGSNRIKVIG